jgi:Lon protease-like protein
MAVSPMFPLGSVLFPSMVLPLHVFEPRYRELTVACIRDEREFGVVLIERGSEVGGGDVRSDIGTLARIVQAQPFPDGRWALVAVGTSRVTVSHWLPDDPYPQADVEPLPDDAVSTATGDDLVKAIALLRAVLARKAELGEPAAPINIELSDDITLASYQVAALAPIGPADRQDLLRAPGPDARLAMLHELLEDERMVLDARLALGATDEDDTDE